MTLDLLSRIIHSKDRVLSINGDGTANAVLEVKEIFWALEIIECKVYYGFGFILEFAIVDLQYENSSGWTCLELLQTMELKCAILRAA
uniref:Uncharacterized protein n=1 Tax=Sphaerodactylus townsendi TaxID=933632 RepID=A0ACB8EHB0_9SAUR